MNTLPNIAQFYNYDFNAGNLSSISGLLPVFTYIDNNHFLDSLSDVRFNDSRATSVYSNFDILASRILFNFTGAWKVSSRFNLRNDPLLQGFLIPSQATDSRLQKRITQDTIDDLTSILTAMACRRILHSDLKEIILDQDSTVIETFGRQQHSGYIPHYKTNGYHPLLLTEHHTETILAVWNRPGNTYASLGSWEQLKPVLALLQENPELRIRYRADSAAFDSVFLAQLEEADVQYFIRAKNTQRLRESVETDLEARGVNYRDYTADNPYTGQIYYSINRSTPRRVVYKAYETVDEKGQIGLFPTIYCVVTNDSDLAETEVMDFYEARGTSENINKVVKDDFFAGNMSHSTLLGNALDLLLCCLSYNMYVFFRNDVMEGKDQSMRMNTYRQKIGSICAKITRHARQVTVSFASNFWNREKFRHYLERASRIQIVPA